LWVLHTKPFTDKDMRVHTSPADGIICALKGDLLRILEPHCRLLVDADQTEFIVVSIALVVIPRTYKVHSALELAIDPLLPAVGIRLYKRIIGHAAILPFDPTFAISDCSAWYVVPVATWRLQGPTGDFIV
jgi:hypothetical protein